ncbi:MAG: hypothetical protein JWQ72_70, partial [Polaromonas sp.]|nr:hypothetical protein [Polaromonas sp.]
MYSDSITFRFNTDNQFICQSEASHHFSPQRTARNGWAAARSQPYNSPASDALDAGGSGEPGAPPLKIHIYTDIDTLFGQAARLWMALLLDAGH